MKNLIVAFAAAAAATACSRCVTVAAAATDAAATPLMLLKEFRAGPNGLRTGAHLTLTAVPSGLRFGRRCGQLCASHSRQPAARRLDCITASGCKRRR